MTTTSITIKKSTKNFLKSFGKKGETYDNVLCNILKHINNCDHFWENRN